MTDIVYNKNGIPFDIDAIATDLNGKMDKDGLNATASVCVESYVNGSSWYRVYSDGWCEQGGKVLATINGASVIFLKPYINTDYTVTTSAYGNNGTDNPYNGGENLGNLSTTGFTFYVGDGSSKNCGWRACGYIR